MKGVNEVNYLSMMSYFSDGTPVPELLTEEEAIRFLRIPEASKSKNYHNVVTNLIRFHDLPRIHIGRSSLYPRIALLEWIDKQTIWN